ncbi:MAG: nucleoside recognition domain-containing protein [Mitsuokella sp.]
MDKEKTPKAGILGYVAFFFAIILFSGIFANADSWLRVFDFNTLNGSFGTITDSAGKALTFRGANGAGARDGFIFAITLIPAVILALGIVNVVDGLGGMRAAQRMMTPILKPLLGIPGATALANIANLQSTDAAAGMVKELYDNKEINDTERSITIMYQTSASATVTNYFGSGPAVFGFMVCPLILPILVMFAFKIIGANMLRVYLKFVSRKQSTGGAE